jgi:hypothetical protein
MGYASVGGGGGGGSAPATAEWETIFEGDTTDGIDVSAYKEGHYRIVNDVNTELLLTYHGGPEFAISTSYSNYYMYYNASTHHIHRYAGTITKIMWRPL